MMYLSGKTSVLALYSLMGRNQCEESLSGVTDSGDQRLRILLPSAGVRLGQRLKAVAAAWLLERGRAAFRKLAAVLKHARRIKNL
jgi:hypothetical protein